MYSQNELCSTLVSDMPRRIDLHHILCEMHGKYSETLTVTTGDQRKVKQAICSFKKQ